MTETQTALNVAQAMNLSDDAAHQLNYYRHPQDRTEAFHRAFDAPIHVEPTDREFSHMDADRVAFRASFILSEAFEIIEKGLGLELQFGVKGTEGPWFKTIGSSNAALREAIYAAMFHGCKRDLVEVVDGLGDLNVVVNGWAVELGVDMVAVDREIYASNLTKLGEDGKPIVADGSDPTQPKGKILKGPNFIEPNLEKLLGV